MQQYLLNASAIWLLSLILFDLLLRREDYHSYNRFYLLFTLLLGTLLPLIQWQYADVVYPRAIRYPIEEVITTKQYIASMTIPGRTISIGQWLMMIYISGALVALALLVVDIVKLLNFYRNGTKHIQNSWTIVTTGMKHAPFSFRRTLFVNAMEQYSPEEWAMVIAHEQRHTSLLHAADLMLLHIARIVFWFHPLIYVYHKRLLLVHEYQADAAATQQQEYGRFLIEQAILAAAPSVSHSFNRSPIKNRILMLTRKSTAAAKGKMLVILPLCMLAIACFSKNGSAWGHQFERNGNTVTYKGNKFILSEPKIDTIILIDPVTGQEQTQYRTFDPQPITMNGNKIYSEATAPYNEENITPRYYASNATLEEYVLKNIAGGLNSLPDGDYNLRISNIVVSENGKVVYYDYGGVERKFYPNTWKPVAKDSVKQITAGIDKFLNDAPALSPGTLKGKAVPAILPTEFSRVNIIVKNHQATIKK